MALAIFEAWFALFRVQERHILVNIRLFSSEFLVFTHCRFPFQLIVVPFSSQKRANSRFLPL